MYCINVISQTVFCCLNMLTYVHCTVFGPVLLIAIFYTYVLLEETNLKSRSGMVKTKPQGSKMKSVPSISQQYEAPILQYDDETAVYENHR